MEGEESYIVEEKTQVASLSVASNTFLTLAKVVIGLASGSVSILSEGIHSGIDLLAALIALFAVRESGNLPIHAILRRIRLGKVVN